MRTALRKQGSIVYHKKVRRLMRELGIRSVIRNLSVVMDLHNNEIITWKLAERNDLQLVLETVNQLDAPGAILHSGQGFQYTTKSYANVLDGLRLIGSHSWRGNCFDNACIFSHLKTEKLHLERPKTYAETERKIIEYIAYYNYERFKKKLGDRSLVEYRKTIAALYTLFLLPT